MSGLAPARPAAPVLERYVEAQPELEASTSSSMRFAPRGQGSRQRRSPSPPPLSRPSTPLRSREAPPASASASSRRTHSCEGAALVVAVSSESSSVMRCLRSRVASEAFGVGPQIVPTRDRRSYAIVVRRLSPRRRPLRRITTTTAPRAPHEEGSPRGEGEAEARPTPASGALRET